MANERTHKLPGIQRIGWVDGNNLIANVRLHGICGSPVGIYTDIHAIAFCGEPECECKTVKDGAGYTDTATLKFHVAEKLPFDRMDNVAFVVTDCMGDSYLLGSREQRASHSCDDKTGTPAGDRAGYSYEIKHVSIKSMVKCII